MRDLEELKVAYKDISDHPAKWAKAVYHFIYSNRKINYNVDLYFDPETKTFFNFDNPDRNGWLNGSAFAVYSVNNEYSEDWEPGRIRETAAYYRENIYDILEEIKDELKDDIEEWQDWRY